jgi:DNA-directed RNA polymerase subunit RPC12/RpoP
MASQDGVNNTPKTGGKTAAQPMAKSPHPKHRCVWCGEQFTNFKALMDHKSKASKDSDSHIHCQYCGADFRSPSTALIHLQQVRASAPNLVFSFRTSI